MTKIERKYTSIDGEESFLGSKTSAETSTENGLGSFQTYEHGMAIYSPSYGACVLTKKIMSKLASSSVAETVAFGGITVKDYLGFPMFDTYKTEEGGEISFFEKGMILSRPRDGEFITGGEFVIYGDIYLYYLRNKSIKGWIGVPYNDIIIGKDNGRIGRFSNADIYWHESTGTFEVHGEIRNRYAELGEEGGFLGYPISDEISVLNNGLEIGRQNNFKNGGTIFWSQHTGAYEVHGDILKSYRDEFNGPAGELGFPTSNEMRSSSDNYRFNNFEKGILVWNKTTKIVQKITKLEFWFINFETSGDADTTSSDDPFFYIKVLPSININGFETSYRLPDNGYYDNTNQKQVDAKICSIPINDGRQKITLKVEAWDYDDGLNGSDNKIGEFKETYDIDALWDASKSNPDAKEWHGDRDSDGDLINGKFKIDFRFDPVSEINPKDSENFRKTLFWNIHNPAGKTKIKDSEGNDTNTDRYPDLIEFSWEIYASTFTDVEQNESHIFHPFNYLFYEYLYKELPYPGTCFGMCLEAIYALHRRSSSNQHIFQYTFDEQRKKDISIKMGYQVGGDQIDFYLSTFFKGDIWNPVRAYQISKELFDRGEYSILCLSSSEFSFEGHAVLPYKWEIQSSEKWVIYLANPNSPFFEAPKNDEGDRMIIINPINNTFSYEHGISERGEKIIWTGTSNNFDGGRLFAMPYSKLSYEPRTPFIEIGLATLVLIPIAIAAAETAAALAAGAVLVGAAATEAAVATGVGAAAIGVAAAEVAVLSVSAGAIALGVINTIFGGVLMICGSDAEITQISDGEKKYFSEDANVNTDSDSKIDNITHISKIGGPSTEQKRPSTYYLRNQHAGEQINQSLSFDISNTGNDEYHWGIASAHSKIILTASASESNIDNVVINEIGTAGQAFGFTSSTDVVDKKIKLDIISFDSQRKFELSNINVPAGKTLKFQHNNAGREIIVYGSTEDISLDLNYFFKDFEKPAISVQKINIEKNVITIIEAITTQQIQKTTYAELGGQPISSTVQTTVSIDGSKLVHRWLTLFNSKGEYQNCLNSPADKPEIGGWYFNLDRPSNFNLADDTYYVIVQSGTYSLIQFEVKQGKISYDSKLEGVITGKDTSNLILHGLPLTIDATAITNHIVYLGGVYGIDGDELSIVDRKFESGNFLPTSNDGIDGWEYGFIMGSGVLASFAFKLSLDGKVFFNPQFNNSALGNGSNVLKILEFTPR